jgi:glycosyltransferase involved in cell wall biosynthesis
MVERALFVTVILHIVTRTNIGGVSQYLENLVNNWSDLSVSHVIVRGSPSIDEGDYLRSHPVNARILEVPSLQRSVTPLREFKALVGLIRVIRKTNPDVVHTHMAKAGVLGRVAAWICRVPVRVHTFHGHLLQGYFSRRTVWLVVQIERLMQGLTTWSITNGERVRQDLIERDVIRSLSSSSIPPAVQPFKIDKHSAKQHPEGAHLSNATAGFVGRLAPIKRPDRFIACARALPEYHFVMFGDGPLGPDIQREVRGLPNVHLAGWVTEPSQIYSAMDVLVLTSDNEAAAIVLIEAAMAGLPAVAMNVGSVSEVVIHEQTGLLVNTESELHSALRRLLADEHLRLQMGSRAREFALSTFTTTRLVDAHQRLYTQLMAR